MKQLLHLKTMLVTLLTMLVAMNASAQTQTYFSCNFDNYTNTGILTSNGWTMSGTVNMNVNSPYCYSGRAVQLGTKNGADGQVTTPALSLPSNVQNVQLSFYTGTGGYDEVSLTVTVLGAGSFLNSDNTTSESVTISVTKSGGNFYTYNLTGCTSATKIKFYANRIAGLDNVVVTGEASSDWKYNPASVNVTYGDNFTAPVLNTNGYNGAITYTSSNESVATVDASSGEVTINAVGETTITARGEDTQNPAAGEASYTLIVKDIQGSATGGTGGSLFHETFDDVCKNGTGGNDGVWGGSAGQKDIVTLDEEGWTLYSWQMAADKCIKQGASGSGKKGYAMTRYIDVEKGKTYTLTFRAAPWDGESTKMVVTVTDGCDISGISSDEMTPKQWNYYEATLTPRTVERIRIKFEAADKNRFFLDEINVAAPSTSKIVNVTIPASGWGTYCCQWPLDFTEGSLPDGFKAYAVSSSSSTNVTLTEISQKLIGGTGIIINGTPGTAYTLKIADNGTAYSGTNLLTGTLSPTYIEKGQYFLKNGQFVYSSAGTLQANKAYLKSANAPEAAENLGFVVEDATGIAVVRNAVIEEDDKWYDLSGRAVSPTSKGIYIHNGKKYVIK